MDHEVLVAGGGPTGLMLAAELALAGVDVAVIERRVNQDLASARSRGLHARTLEVLDQRGVADRFLSQGQPMQVVGFRMNRLDISDFPTRHNYGLALTQDRFERILDDWVGELPVTRYRGREVTGLTQQDDAVDVALADGATMRAQYLAGCDGGRSIVRKAAGIAFPGWNATTSWIIAEVEATEPPRLGFHHDGTGTHAIGPGTYAAFGIVLMEREVRSGATPTMQELRDGLVAAYGTDFGVHSPQWISRFSDASRQAAQYRSGRVLLAGDAAHVHPPMGGQGLNIGVQDAINLGWKLAQVVRGTSPESLLDTYHAERHPVAARVLRNTMAQVALARTDERTQALNETIAEWLTLDEPRRVLAGEMSGLAVHYDLGAGHPLLGRRMPDLDLVTAHGATRVYTLLHQARPLLLRFGTPGAIDDSARVRRIHASYDGVWELPVIGVVSAPTAVLVRPDGYAAWVGEGDTGGLDEALVRWFGGS